MIVFDSLTKQGLQRSAELDVNRYSALEATNVQLRRQVEQLELLCKEQAEAAQQLSKRQQVNTQLVTAKIMNSLLFTQLIRFLSRHLFHQDREVLAERLKAKTEYGHDLVRRIL